MSTWVLGLNTARDLRDHLARVNDAMHSDHVKQRQREMLYATIESTITRSLKDHDPATIWMVRVLPAPSEQIDDPEFVVVGVKDREAKSFVSSLIAEISFHER